ncbi:MAG: hypothetical protein AAF372_05310, partial [Pseudomonadota bacterium]
ELDMDPRMIFFKNMRIFRAHPVDEHYPYFLELMEKVATAHEGIVPQENVLIEKFKSYFPLTGLRSETNLKHNKHSTKQAMPMVID